MGSFNSPNDCSSGITEAGPGLTEAPRRAEVRALDGPPAPSPRGTRALGDRAFSVLSSALFVLGACTRSVTTQTVKSPVLERRTQLNANEPLLRSEWRVEGGRIVGQVTWGSCESERSWTIEEQRVESVRPLPSAGLLTAGVGAAAIIGGLVAYDGEPKLTCTDVYSQQAGVPGYQTCTSSMPENTGSKVAVLSGTAALAAGLLMLAVKPSDTVRVLKHEPHVEKTSSPCIVASDLSVMSLLLKLGPNRFAHITVAANGEASADLPASARLPRGKDLEVLVYRAPPALAKILPQWTVFGHVHVPE